MIVLELIDRALALSDGRTIKDVRAGLGYTCVMLEDDHTGLAYTFRDEMGCCCGILHSAGKLIGMKVNDIIPWAREKDRLKAAIGVAAINAVLNDPDKNWDTGNVLEAFTLSESDHFGMIGEFKPILKVVQSMTKNIYVFAQDVPENSLLYPSRSIPNYLPRCEVVVLTATSIINHTFDEISPYLKNAKEVCLVGPSTPLCPQIFRNYNMTLLAGSVVTKPEQMLQIVSQGGGTMAMKPAIEQVLVRV
ncbi:MAG: DUF364 domain-containing protein [Clostridia bacterium]|nr:DUF364 domain-containing protein [Clostridia bacterium]